jgi:membrane-bound ClpP family serine protease
MKYFDMYITLIFIVKIVFIVLAVYRLYTKAKNPKSNQIETIEKSILLIYLFNPRANHIGMIDNETKILLYLFGLILLLTENWSSFIHESFLFKNFSHVLG